MAALTPPSLFPEAGTQGRQVQSPWVFAEEELPPQRWSHQPSCPPLSSLCMYRTFLKWVSKPSGSFGCFDFIWTMESVKNGLIRFKHPSLIVAKLLGWTEAHLILLHPCSVSVLILHLIGLQPVWPSHGWPRQVHQHMPSIYLHSSKSHSSGLPGSACTASPGSCPTSLKTTAQRCSGPGSRGPSALQSSALAAAAHRHTTPPVKAQHQVQHLRRVRSKGTWFCSSTWCLLPLLLLHFLFYIPCNTMTLPTCCSHLRACIEGSITTNKAGGGDGIPVELFQILKDDAVKVLHSICQQTWKTQQWPQDWKRSVSIPIPKKSNAKECSNYLHNCTHLTC